MRTWINEFWAMNQDIIIGLAVAGLVVVLIGWMSGFWDGMMGDLFGRPEPTEEVEEVAYTHHLVIEALEIA